MTGDRIRRGARGLVIDEQDNVLLVNFDWDGLDIPGGFWACPGGGIEEGELPEDALRRELEEEIGLAEPTIGGALWSLTRLFEMPGWDGQEDTWFLVRTSHFDPQPQVDLLEENVHGLRWFTKEELRQGVVPFSPRDLALQLEVVLANGVPTKPRVIECLP